MLSQTEGQLVRISRQLAQETPIYGPWLLARRGLRKIVSRMHGRLLGWPNSSVPIGSNIAGTKHIRVERGFFATGAVWIEAITAFGGDSHQPSITIGANLNVSERLHVSAINSVSIGNNCLIGSNVYIADHAHGNYRGALQSSPQSEPAQRPLAGTGAVEIGDNCWFGDNVIILGGVKIGDGAIVAANSVVLSNVPAGTIVAGAPATVRKAFDESLKSWTKSSRI